jgi:hypothetical protein
MLALPGKWSLIPYTVVTDVCSGVFQTGRILLTNVVSSQADTGKSVPKKRPENTTHLGEAPSDSDKESIGRFEGAVSP